MQQIVTIKAISLANRPLTSLDVLNAIATDNLSSLKLEISEILISTTEIEVRPPVTIDP